MASSLAMETDRRLPTARPTRALIVVFIVLGLIGLLALWTAVRLLMEPTEQPNAFLGPLLIGLVLTGIGLIMPFVLARAARRQSRRVLLQEQHPGEPWMWRDDWASGRITGTTGAVAGAMWLFVIVWNAFTWPVAWLFLTQRSSEPGIQFVLLFPAVGVLLLGIAIRGALQHRKYGASLLVLRSNPGVIGRTLEADIETRIETAPASGFDVQLQCLRRYTTGHGKTRQTHSRTLWKDQVTVQAADTTRGPLGVRVPVVVAIPPSAVSSNDADPSDRIEWHVTASARVAGVDYSDAFEVPVFITGAPPLTSAERDALMATRRTHAAAFVPENTVMRIQPSAAGTVFAFKPKTKLTSALGAILMTAASWAGTIYLIRAGIPIAPFIVGFFGVLFTAGTMVALFHRSSVTVAHDEVTIRHRILGVGTTRRFRQGDILDVRSEVVGEGKAQSWEIKVHTRERTSFSAGAMIPSQIEADWSAEQIRSVIRPRSNTVQPG